MKKGDHGQDRLLLDLDGQVFVVDPAGKYWVKFVVNKVPATAEKPHGLDYSLTLHGENNERLAGFDNTHAVRTTGGPGGRKHGSYDHKHRLKTTRPYEYKSAEQLLVDFWTLVDAVLKEKGVKT